MAAALAQALRDASRIVLRVQEGRSLSHELERQTETPRSALIDLCHGTLRQYGRVNGLVRILSERHLPEPTVQALLWCALYALDSGRYPDYTVVDQAVAACSLLGAARAKSYVNALLRAYVRKRAAVEGRLANDAEARYRHPAWWIAALRSAYPGEWEAILDAGNGPPPMCLRVNLRRGSVERYRQRLAEAGIGSKTLSGAALLLERPLPVDRLPGFAEGDVSVQDFAAQRAANLLELEEGQRVLDACAAPGGKSAHILESQNVELLSLDADAARSRLVERTFARLKLAGEVRAADCTDLGAWWDGRAFDRVLADVPCSASGVVRRHPDVKWLRRRADLDAFAQKQAAILDSLWQVLAPGGKLLYGTCSVFPRENEDVVGAFLARTTDARRAVLGDGGPSQWLPAPEHDGFYFALIEKTS